MSNAYHYIGEAWKGIEKQYGSAQWDRLVQWREGDSFVKVDKPLRLNKARARGNKASQGNTIVIARVRRGDLRKQRLLQGRVPTQLGGNPITMLQNTLDVPEHTTSPK